MENILTLRRKPFLFKLIKCVVKSFPTGIKTAKWLLKITIPVSFLVFLMDYSGLLNTIAGYTQPVFKYLGLPGVAAIVLITSIFTSMYAVIAVLTMLALPIRDGSIIGIMCLISHGFLIETAILKKTGSSPVRMVLLRLGASFAVAWILNLFIPGNLSDINKNIIIERAAFTVELLNWCISMLWTIIKILILVNLLLILQKALQEFGLIKYIVKPLIPLMRLFGLPINTTFLWIVANTLGLAYGAAVILNQFEEGKLTKEEADLLNHHIAVSHSQLEDPLLFLSLGYNPFFLIWPRVLMAVAVVWIRRLELFITGKIKNS